MDCRLRDGAEHWTGNPVQLPHHRACSEGRFSSRDGLFATLSRMRHPIFSRFAIHSSLITVWLLNRPEPRRSDHNLLQP